MISEGGWKASVGWCQEEAERKWVRRNTNRWEGALGTHTAGAGTVAEGDRGGHLPQRTWRRTPLAPR